MEISSQLWILLDVCIASVLAGVVGFEREYAQKPAGFRTNMIVAGSSCLLIAICVPLIKFVEDDVDVSYINTDPIRVMEAIIVGVSFIGAGTILKLGKEHDVRFLTTAATLLYSAGIGITVALEHYVLAIGLTLIILTINYLINKLSRKLEEKIEK
jgi:putative Mg2+ transporter-C (MgtC) family protein